MKTMRTPETEAKYQKYLKTKPEGCPLCDDREVEIEFKHWRLVKNKFPYDLVADRSDMLVTKKHTLNLWDRILAETELAHILDTLDEVGLYQVFIRNFSNRQTVKNHKHYHLLEN